MQKLAIVIPAYNESASISGLIRELNATQIDGFQLVPVVVNDCSKDNTAEIVRKENCVLIDLPVNLGIGGAVQSGFIYAYENNFDFAIQVDGDGQHPPREIVKLLNCLIAENANIVIGSRFISKEGFQSSGLRRMGINYLRYLILLLTGKKITDATSGFRLFDRKTLELVQNYYPDEYPEPESLIYFHRKKLKIVETQVEMLERQGGVSSIRAFKTIYYMVKVSLAIFYTFIRTK